MLNCFQIGEKYKKSIGEILFSFLSMFFTAPVLRKLTNTEQH
jgi:hypothetical protein